MLNLFKNVRVFTGHAITASQAQSADASRSRVMQGTQARIATCSYSDVTAEHDSDAMRLLTVFVKLRKKSYPDWPG